jgi:hypothetical protein
MIHLDHFRRGSQSAMVVPPGPVEGMVSRPPNACMTEFARKSPIPEPFSSFFLIMGSLNKTGLMCSGMPFPVSEIRISTPSF